MIKSKTTFSLASFFIFSSVGLVGCGGVAQGEACQKYISCQEYYNDQYAISPRDLSGFEAEGSCWRSESVAAGCEERCEVATSQLKGSLQDNNADVGACN
ncbi:MAG: hypothetical protein GY822_31840 [Deltaproteobacteria bacterium]|nr:hypothetical protein [Deltaproteobacteria bacterium]